MSNNERTSLLDHRKVPTNYTTEDPILSIPLPSPFAEQEPFTYPTVSTPRAVKNKDGRFKWFNKRTGLYDEDRQGLVKENTGIRVWSESYSSIGKFLSLLTKKSYVSIDIRFP